MKLTLLNTDRELFIRLQEGDKSAFAKIYEIYAPELISFTTARLSSLEEAKDIIHDLFVELWQERQHTAITTSIRAFLYGATRYKIIDHIRRNAIRKKYTEKIARLPNREISLEDDLYARELQEQLRQAVNDLPCRTKDVFCMSRFEHKSIKEIAEQLGTSEQTVKNQLTTALKLLRTKLAKIAFILW